MTVDIYGHLIPGSNREQVNLLALQPSATIPSLSATCQNRKSVTYKDYAFFNLCGAEGGI